MPTPKQLYARKLAEIARRFDTLDDGLILRMVEMLKGMRARLASDLLTSDPASFSAFRMRELMGNVENMASQLEGQLGRSTLDASRQAAELGGRYVSDPLNELGLGTIFNAPSQAQVNVALDFTADLIRSVSAELVRKINPKLRIAALGELSPFDTMKAIDRVIGITGNKITGGVSYQSERILRTELNRIFNLSAHSQQQAAANQIPGLLKRWLATGDSRTRYSHLVAHTRYQANPIPVAESFRVGGADLMYPLDPAGPAKETINCRCRSVTIHPEIGVIGMPLDGRIATEKERRASETWQTMASPA